MLLLIKYIIHREMTVSLIADKIFKFNLRVITDKTFTGR
jgi:hypothetical protein